MIGRIKSIHNKCINEGINFLCCESCDIIVNKFLWRGHERENTSLGNITTCMRNNTKIVTIGFSVINIDNRVRTVNRKFLEKVFGNYSCCSECCQLRVEFIDDDGEEYYFDAKIGSEIVSDNINGSSVGLTYEYSLEVCGGKFINLKENKVCGEVGSVGGVSLPNCNGIVCNSCYSGSKIIKYEGGTCGGYKVEITANNLVNPVFNNLTSNGRYGLIGTFNGTITIDTKNGIFINGQHILPNQRSVGSNINNIKLLPGDNELLLTSYSGNATYCIIYTNDIN